ncbi:MAG TPA: hypothetical protein VN201_11415 [Roseateles sp.]|nr:hypothetical protein [Roseateles sp.]
MPPPLLLRRLLALGLVGLLGSVAAQPLPAPPPDIRGSQIAIVVPINYNLRKTR